MKARLITNGLLHIGRCCAAANQWVAVQSEESWWNTFGATEEHRLRRLVLHWERAPAIMALDSDPLLSAVAGLRPLAPGDTSELVSAPFVRKKLLGVRAKINFKHRSIASLEDPISVADVRAEYIGCLEPIWREILSKASPNKGRPESLRERAHALQKFSEALVTNLLTEIVMKNCGSKKAKPSELAQGLTEHWGCPVRVKNCRCVPRLQPSTRELSVMRRPLEGSCKAAPPRERCKKRWVPSLRFRRLPMPRLQQTRCRPPLFWCPPYQRGRE